MDNCFKCIGPISDGNGGVMKKGEGCFDNMVMTSLIEFIMFWNVRWCCNMRDTIGG